jgi:hypothetical protein
MVKNLMPVRLEEIAVLAQRCDGKDYTSISLFWTHVNIVRKYLIVLCKEMNC